VVRPRRTGRWRPRELIREKRGIPDDEVPEWLRRELGIVLDNQSDKGRSGGRRIVEAYDYRDERGALLFQVVRFEPKDFRQRRPDGKGGWTWSVKGIRPVPYRLPELLAVPADALVFIVEGEKDANNLAELGLIATCNAGGAAKRGKDGKPGKSKWRPELLTGR
jgi:hypothetical protein